MTGATVLYYTELGAMVCVWLFAGVLLCMIVAFISSWWNGELKEKP